MISKARDHLCESTVVDVERDKPVENLHRKSKEATVYAADDKDSLVFRLVVRGAMLLGVPTRNVENVGVTRYIEGDYFKHHHDAFDDSFFGNRSYTILVYLNDVDDASGGATVFRDLNVAVRPKLGRAVCWANRTPDGRVNTAATHGGEVIKNGAEKWVVQMFFRVYSMFDGPADTDAFPLGETGIPLRGDEDLPAGASIREAANEESALTQRPSSHG